PLVEQSSTSLPPPRVASREKDLFAAGVTAGEAGEEGGVIVLMRAGRILQQGSLRALVEAPADPFVTRFLRAHRAPLGDAAPAHA
ncbi:MAG TPA: hypothetical protein VGQ83_03595, partial [Polyangia bacterium]